MSAKDGSVRVAIVSSQATDRAALERMLSPPTEFCCAANCAGVDEALRRVQAGQCDLAVIDLQWLGKGALECIRGLKAHLSAPKIMALFGPGYESYEWLYAALRAGAEALATKPVVADEYLSTMRRLMKNGHALCPGLLRKLPSLFGPPAVGAGAPPTATATPVTGRLGQTAALVALGFSNKQIADWLGVGEDTIDTLCRRLFDHYHAYTRAAVVAVWQRSLVLPPQDLIEGAFGDGI